MKGLVLLDGFCLCVLLLQAVRLNSRSAHPTDTSGAGTNNHALAVSRECAARVASTWCAQGNKMWLNVFWRVERVASSVVDVLSVCIGLKLKFQAFTSARSGACCPTCPV